MQLTPLEAVLIGVVVAAIAGLITHFLTSRLYQTRAGCEDRHKAVCADLCEIRASAARDRDDSARVQSLILRMLRAAIMHLPIEDKVKASIINDKVD